jgi:DNA-directed RNA polymerase alpha subunit
MSKTDSTLPVNDFPADLAQPARRALAEAGIQNLPQLAQFSEAEIRRLHGIGPNALEKLRRVLAKKGLSFRTEETH